MRNDVIPLVAAEAIPHRSTGTNIVAAAVLSDLKSRKPAYFTLKIRPSLCAYGDSGRDSGELEQNSQVSDNECTTREGPTHNHFANSVETALEKMTTERCRDEK